jgi:hypothetical protein
MLATDERQFIAFLLFVVVFVLLFRETPPPLVIHAPTFEAATPDQQFYFTSDGFELRNTI